MLDLTPFLFLGLVAAFVVQIRFQQRAAGIGLVGFGELVGGIVQVGVSAGNRVADLFEDAVAETVVAVGFGLRGGAVCDLLSLL